MDFFQHPYYKKNKLLLSVIGQWPYHNTRSDQVIRIVLHTIVITHIGAQILACIKYQDDWEILMDCIVPLIFDGIMIAKVTCYYCNSQKMLVLLDRIRTDWQVWAGDREVNVLHKYADQGRRVIVVYASTLYTTSILYMIQPILPKLIDVLLKNGSELGEFPIPLDYYHLDMQKYYFYIILHSCLCIIAAYTTMIAMDSILIVYVQHACGIFAALGQRLERIGEDEKYEETSCALNRCDRDLEHVVSCIRRHDDAIKYAEMIDTTFSWSFFFIVGFNILGNTITGLQVINGTTAETAKFLFCTLVGVVHLYLENYMAQILMDHSTNIRYCIYYGKWYKISPKAQKLLKLMMTRCDVPCKLTAGNVVTLSVEAFATFLKTTLSYFTVLRSL